MKKPLSVLMISFHFPPISGSSGYLRLLKFAKFLPQFGINPTVLTAKSSAYEAIAPENEKLLKQIDPIVRIERATALDTSKHLSIKGKYLSWMALPDKWMSWIPFAIVKGISLHKEKPFDAIWTTYPISSSLVIGYYLSKLLKRKLYVDLRDPVWEEETWQGTQKQRLLRWLERKVIHHAEKVIFTSPGTIDKYKRRYEEALHDKFTLLLNGYDEDDFKELPTPQPTSKKLFLHSGLLPGYERDPSHFFNAIAELKSEQLLDPTQVVFRLRATGNQAKYQKATEQLNINDIVDIAPPISYKEALAEMQTASCLMIFQHRTCDWQTPAKLFEYFFVNKPLLIFAGKNSDTIKITKQTKTLFSHAELDDIPAIKLSILLSLEGKFTPGGEIEPSTYSRKLEVKALSKLFLSALVAP